MPFIKRKAQSEVASHLAQGTEFTGEFSFSNGALLDGVVKGKIRAEATLEIGPKGTVDAEVAVRRILIRGEFRGVIHASDRVEILREGKVFGDIFAPCLIIEAGAVFEGRCNMSNREPTVSSPKIGQ